VGLCSLLPTDAAKSLMQLKHVDKGCEVLFLQCFAAIFLHCPGLPLRHHAHRWDFFCARGVQPGQPSQQGGAASDVEPHSPHPWSEESLSQQFTDELRKLASACHRDTVCDFSCLLDVGETLTDLMELSIADFLLRWIGCKIDEEGVERLTWAGLKDDCWRRLFLLLRVVADDVAPLVKDAEQGMATESRYAALVEWAGRCTPCPILSWESLARKRMSDVIAFVAALYLSRPCCKPAKGSHLQKHLDVMQEALIRCTTLSRQDLAIKVTDVGFRPITQLCLKLHSHHKAIGEADAAFAQMRALQETLESQVTSFMWKLLQQPVASAAWGAERKEMPEVIKRRQVLPAQRIWELLASEGATGLELPMQTLAWEQNAEATALVQSILDVLRVHKDPFDTVFNQHASLDHRTWCQPERQGAVGKGTEVLDLRGLFMMHREGHWRKYVSSYQLEVIFIDVLSPRSSQEAGAEWMSHLVDDDELQIRRDEVKLLGGCLGKGLNRQGFAEVLLLICLRAKLHADATADWRVDLRFKEFITRHLEPLAHTTHDDDRTLFNEIFYDSATSLVLSSCEMPLRAVFEAYADVDEAIKMVTYSGFQQMCNHAGLSGSSLDEISPRIFRGLRAVQLGGLVDAAGDHDSDQASSSDSDGEHAAYTGDLSRSLLDFHGGHRYKARQQTQRRIADFPPSAALCFLEFAEALLAVVLYIDPNPFIRVSVRVERFLQKRLFRQLRRYHRSLLAKEVGDNGFSGVSSARLEMFTQDLRATSGGLTPSSLEMCRQDLNTTSAGAEFNLTIKLGDAGDRSFATLLEALEDHLADEHMSELEEQLGEPSPKQAHTFKKEMKQHPKPRRGKT